MWQPVAPERTNFAGWPFAVVFGPLHALLGTVGAWNAFVLFSYVGAGAFAALWLRALGLPFGAALVGGLAFALAPYRSIQTSGGHLLGPISMLLPLSLWALETSRAWLAVAAIASVPLAGQVHLALGAIPLFVAYALVRGRRSAGVVGAGVAVLAGLLVYIGSIRGTTGAAGRSFGQVEKYSADVLDFVARSPRHGFETFVFLGWLVPLLAVAGLVLLARGRLVTHSYKLATLLALAVVVPIVLAFGANTPLYEPLWSATPGLGHTRVPGRLLPIACLALAAGLALLVAACHSELRARGRRALWVSVVAAVLVAADLRVNPYRALVADENNTAYASVDGPGALLDVPVHLPETQKGSVYLYYTIQAPRPRPLGYSTTAPPEVDIVARSLRNACTAAYLRQLGVRYVALHGEQNFACAGGGPRPLASDVGVTVLTYP